MIKRLTAFISILGLVGCATVHTQDRSEKKSVDQDLRVQDQDKNAELKKRVVILPFKDDTQKVQDAEMERAEEEFARSLQKTNQVIVIDPLAKKDSPPKIDSKEALQDALRRNSVQAIISANLEELKLQRGGDQIGIFRQMKTIFIAKVRMKVLHARTKRELMNTLKTVTVEDSNFRIAEKGSEFDNFRKNPEVLRKVVSQAFTEFIPQVLEALSGTYWEGRIARVANDRIYLNVGKVSGVQVGDLLKVLDEGEEIYDKSSGRYIGKAPGRTKGTLEITGFFGDDGSIAIVHSGAGFQEDDRVELYQQ